MFHFFSTVQLFSFYLTITLLTNYSCQTDFLNYCPAGSLHVSHEHRIYFVASCSWAIYLIPDILFWRSKHCSLHINKRNIFVPVDHHFRVSTDNDNLINVIIHFLNGIITWTSASEIKILEILLSVLPNKLFMSHDSFKHTRQIELYFEIFIVYKFMNRQLKAMSLLYY